MLNCADNSPFWAAKACNSSLAASRRAPRLSFSAVMAVTWATVSCSFIVKLSHSWPKESDRVWLAAKSSLRDFFSCSNPVIWPCKLAISCCPCSYCSVWWARFCSKVWIWPCKLGIWAAKSLNSWFLCSKSTTFAFNSSAFSSSCCKRVLSCSRVWIWLERELLCFLVKSNWRLISPFCCSKVWICASRLVIWAFSASNCSIRPAFSASISLAVVFSCSISLSPICTACWRDWREFSKSVALCCNWAECCSMWIILACSCWFSSFKSDCATSKPLTWANKSELLCCNCACAAKREVFLLTRLERDQRNSPPKTALKPNPS